MTVLAQQASSQELSHYSISAEQNSARTAFTKETTEIRVLMCTQSSNKKHICLSSCNVTMLL